MAYGKGNLGGPFIKSIQRFKSGVGTQAISEVDVDNTIVVMNGVSTSTLPAEAYSGVTLTDATTVTITSLFTSATVSFTVIEFYNLKSKQSFTTTLSAGNLSTNQTISQVNILKTFVLLHGYTNNGSGSDGARFLPHIYLTSATNVEIVKSSTLLDTTVYFDVVEVY